MRVQCDYCGAAAQLEAGRHVYPHRPDLADKRFWVCRPCDARVGCHPGGDKPLGRLANAELRAAKGRAHKAFDPLWKARGWSRGKAYGWLAKRLRIPREECHIGMFDVERCERTVEVCLRQSADVDE